MGNNRKRLFLRMLTLLISVLFTAAVINLTAYAAPEVDDPMIVVSMGDSYSSGEGIEPFYGQDSQFFNKTDSEDWLAHRSAKSWPSKLVVPGYEGESGDKTMADYKCEADVLSQQNADAVRIFAGNCEWFFVASSGAVTDNINSTEQEKTFRQEGVNGHKKNTRYLPVQLDIFNRIHGTVDFVTITIGGNDVDFAKIIETCATRSTYLGSINLEMQLSATWHNFGTTREKIKQTYINISNAAPEANIIVANYPQLLDPSGKGFVISKEEAELVNSNVRKFNRELEKIVEECSNEGLKIHFVDVVDIFRGHEAYSEDPWINKIILGSQKEELDDKAISSAYSMHPNEKGTDAYAECVNEMIRSLCDTPLQVLMWAEEEDMSQTLNDGTVYFRGGCWPIQVFIPEFGEAERIIQQEIKATTDSFREDANRVKEDTSAHFDNDYGPSVYEAPLDDAFVSGRALSFSWLPLSYHSGSAHGAYSSVQKNYDAVTGSQLSLKDLLKEGTDFSILRDLWRSRLGDLDSLFYGPDECLSKIELSETMKSGWYFSKDGLTLVFPQGMISSYGALTIKVPIPYSDLKEIIKEEYLPVDSSAEAGGVSIISSRNQPQSGIRRQFGFQEESLCLHTVSPADNIRVYTVKDATEHQSELKYLTLYINHMNSSDLVYLKELPSGEHYEVE